MIVAIDKGIFFKMATIGLWKEFTEAPTAGAAQRRSCAHFVLWMAAGTALVPIETHLSMRGNTKFSFLTNYVKSLIPLNRMLDFAEQLTYRLKATLNFVAVMI